MKLVRLYGFLGEQFGEEHPLDIEMAGEAVKALCATVEGFEQAVIENQKFGFRLLVDDEYIPKEKFSQLVGSTETIKLVPVLMAAKSDGVQMLVGAALIFSALALGPSTLLFDQYFFEYEMSTELASTLTLMGASMMMGGMAQMLATTPSSDQGSIGNKSDSPSYVFSGPVNTAAQGSPIPILYGRLRVGSIVLSSGIDSNAFYADNTAPNNAGSRGGDGNYTPYIWAVAPAVGG